MAKKQALHFDHDQTGNEGFPLGRCPHPIVLKVLEKRGEVDLGKHGAH